MCARALKQRSALMEADRLRFLASLSQPFADSLPLLIGSTNFARFLLGALSVFKARVSSEKPQPFEPAKGLRRAKWTPGGNKSPRAKADLSVSSMRC